MPNHIVRLEDRYFEYSTVVDAPVSHPMTREEFRAYYYSPESAHRWRPPDEELDERLARVDAKGTSSMHDASAEDTIRCNRAGPNEDELTIEQLRAWARGEKSPAFERIS